jgi:hypothetical protein
MNALSGSRCSFGENVDPQYIPAIFTIDSLFY